MTKIETMFGLHEHAAFVTGAARGLGKAIATALADCGAKVILADRDSAGVEAAAAEIRESGAWAQAVQIDISDPAQVAAAFESAAAAIDGNLDILVNNAAMLGVLPIMDERLHIWQRMQDVNVRGTYLCIREAVKLMRAHGKGGRIVNISSTAAIRPVLDDVTPYSASKGAVNAMTLSLAYELAPDNITVNAIMPHAIAHATAAAQYEENDTPVSGGAALDSKRYRLPKAGEPSDIAMMAAFLAGPGGSYITGQLISIDGGYLVS